VTQAAAGENDYREGMPIRHDDPRPPFQQLADELRTAIAAGELAEGQRLPSTRDLADQYGIAPMTAQSAMRVLRDEGLVVSLQGRGTFVQEDARAKAKENVQHRSGDVSAMATELRSIQATLRWLDDRLTRLEARSPGAKPRSRGRARQPDG
jgi:DNA-binding GntR family transcriptional regulator